MLAAHPFDVVISDIDLRGVPHGTILGDVRRVSDAEVVFTLARVADPRRLDAMRRGAMACLDKPIDLDEAMAVITRAVERRQSRGDARTARDQASALVAMHDGARFDNLVAESATMRRTIDLAQHTAGTDALVLLAGEGGTGKSTIARAIHAASARHAGPYVAVRCDLLPEAALEAELFGHAGDDRHPDHPGLLERTRAGTVVLDAVDALPLGLQAKLDRAIRERRIRRAGDRAERDIDVRLICSSSLDLRTAVAAGAFRRDLHARLDILPVALPRLRDRREDLPLLVTLFTHRHHRLRRAPTLSASALALLSEQPWPGNLRALETAIRSVLATGSPLSASAFGAHLAAVRPTARPAQRLRYREVVAAARDRATRAYLAALLVEFAGDTNAAARRACISPTLLRRLLESHGFTDHSR
jgi:two-component system response regulator HydG